MTIACFRLLPVPVPVALDEALLVRLEEDDDGNVVGVEEEAEAEAEALAAAVDERVTRPEDDIVGVCVSGVSLGLLFPP